MSRTQLLAIGGDTSYLVAARRLASRANDHDTGRRLLTLNFT